MWIGDAMTSQLIPVLSETELREIDREIAHAPYRHAVAIDALKIVQSPLKLA